jgi:hypothetical protein
MTASFQLWVVRESANVCVQQNRHPSAMLRKITFFFDRNPIILFQSAVRNHAIGT